MLNAQQIEVDQIIEPEVGIEPEADTQLSSSSDHPVGTEPLDDVCDLSGVRLPHINIHVFLESDAFRQTWENTARDRRMQNTTTTVFNDGFLGAIKKYTKEESPNLIIVETDSTEDILEFQTDSLAEVCDPGTELIVIGHRNDIRLYQKLMSMGVSNYMVYPISVSSIITAIHTIYREPERSRIGRLHAVIGAKGGVGASTVAQNVALEMAAATQADVLLIDMDLCFGTASLNMDVEANQGLRELIDQSERVDGPMLDRVLIKHGTHLNLLGAMPNLLNDRELDRETVERVLDAAVAHMPNVVLDLPHSWAPWVQTALTASDRVVVVTTPEIGALRNAGTMLSHLKGMRPNDRPPSLVVNQSGMPGRQEIAERDIQSVLSIRPEFTLPFDAKTLSRAAGAGKLLGEYAGRKPLTRKIQALASCLAERKSIGIEKSPRKRSLFSLSKR